MGLLPTSKNPIKNLEGPMGLPWALTPILLERCIVGVRGSPARAYVTPGCRGRWDGLSRPEFVMRRSRRVRLLPFVGKFMARKSLKIPDLREWGLLEHSPERGLATLLHRISLPVCRD